jgi:hypothetical protein
VQSPHVAASAQGSGAGHSLPSQLQPPQLPVSGPVELPSPQVPVSAHQPHGYSPVQLPQSVCTVQSVPPHSLPSQLQSEQLPASGPVEVPCWQLPEPSPHQPQLLREVQSPQSAASAHGSLPPPHSLPSQLQSEQLPPSGPPELPSWQVPVSPHHPQG